MNRIIKSNYKSLDKAEIFLNGVHELIETNKYEEAESKLLNAIEYIIDYRIYFELGKVQRILNSL